MAADRVNKEGGEDNTNSSGKLNCKQITFGAFSNCKTLTQRKGPLTEAVFRAFQAGQGVPLGFWGALDAVSRERSM